MQSCREYELETGSKLREGVPPPYPSSTVRSRTREDRFHHNDRSRAQRGGIGASPQQGVVMSRKKTETQRLPDACYDVRPASKQRGHN